MEVTWPTRTPAMSTSSPTTSPVTSENTARYPVAPDTPELVMLIPRMAVASAVTTMKTIDLISGPLMLARRGGPAATVRALIAPSPPSRGRPARPAGCPARQRPRRLPQGQPGELGDQLVLLRRVDDAGAA